MRGRINQWGLKNVHAIGVIWYSILLASALASWVIALVVGTGSLLFKFVWPLPIGGAIGYFGSQVVISIRSIKKDRIIRQLPRDLHVNHGEETTALVTMGDGNITSLVIPEDVLDPRHPELLTAYLLEQLVPEKVWPVIGFPGLQKVRDVIETQEDMDE